MSGVEANRDAASTAGALHANARQMLLAIILLCALAYAADVQADDTPKLADGDFNAIAKTGPFALSRATLDSVATPDQASSNEFRPHRRNPPPSSIDVSRPLSENADLQATNVWQRMGQYRTFNGVRLLTLWQSRFNTVSVQSGKHGGPSLQWSSHVGGVDSTRGVFDQFIPGQKTSLHAVLIGQPKPPTQPAAKVLASP